MSDTLSASRKEKSKESSHVEWICARDQQGGTVMSAVTAVSIFVNIVLLYFLLLTAFGRGYARAMREDERPPRFDKPRPRFRRFIGKRYEDVTGISGTGVPVEGVVFSDGWGVTHWLDRAPMNEPKTEVWHNPWYRRRGPDPFTKVSGHGGKTEVLWIDEP